MADRYQGDVAEQNLSRRGRLGFHLINSIPTPSAATQIYVYRPLTHPLDPQEMCNMPCHAKHSSITLPRQIPDIFTGCSQGLGWVRPKLCLVHPSRDIWGEASICEQGQALRKQQKYSQTAENIFARTSTNLREKGFSDQKDRKWCRMTAQ